MNWLELLRRIRGMASNELADATGIHPATYCRIEGGWQARVGPKDAQRLADYYGDQWTSEKLLRKVELEDIKWPV